MKNIFLLIVIILACACPSQAQYITKILESPSTTNSVDGIVRCTEDSMWYVSYHRESATEKVFLLFDINGTVCQRMKIPSGFYLEDFEVRSDVVCFCGTMGGMGIFGYFYIADFWNPVGNIYYDKLSNVECASKICTYIDSSDNQIVAAIIGCKPYPNGSMQYREMHIYKIQGNTYGGCIYSGTLLSGNYANSVIDITITDKYIVAAGHVPSYLSLAWIAKTNILSCSYATISEPDFSNNVLVEKLNDDQFALVDEVFSSGTFYDRIRTIDIPTHTVLYSQEIAIPEKTITEDLLYVRQTGVLLMNQETKHWPTYQDYFYYINPYNNNYVSDIMYDDDSWYYKMDQVGEFRFITAANYYPGSTNHRFLIRDITAPASSKCLKFMQFNATPRSPEKIMNSSTSTSEYNGFFNVETTNSTSVLIKGGCEE